MPMISVKAKEGRVAYDSPRGNIIPTDDFKLVDDTPWIRRLLEVHGDIEVEVQKPAAPVAKETK